MALSITLVPQAMLLPAQAEDVVQEDSAEVVVPEAPADNVVQEDEGHLTVTKEIQGWEDGHAVAPGEAFQYTITVTCTNTGFGGCTNAELTDQLPPWVLPNGEVSVIGADSDVTVDGSFIDVAFTTPLTEPPGEVGLPDAATVTINIPVILDPNIPATESGNPLVNVAEVTGSNTNTDEDDFTVVPEVPIVLAAGAQKAYEPGSAIPNPGTPVTLTLGGSNDSNVPVDTLELQDPADPAAEPNPFEHLEFTGGLQVVTPEGADNFVVSVWVDGAWINAPPNSTELPADVDPADIRGLRVSYTSTDGTIVPGAGGQVIVDLVHRDTVADLTDPYVVDNVVSAVVAVEDDSSAPALAEDDYTFVVADIPLEASKLFNPDPIAVGTQSTATLTATNTSDLTLDTLSITEPGADGPNPFTGGLTFSGWAEGVQWPAGATAASVTYLLADGSEVTLDADAPNTLPAPPEGAEVHGFTTTFTGAIVPGAQAITPFVVTASADQDVDEVQHLNRIQARSTAPGGFVGGAVAEDTLTTIIERLSVAVDKRITPAQILSIPGEVAVVQLHGILEPFPASTTDAHRIVVQDPADPATDGWWDAFAATSIVATPIPADATLTVEYFDGTDWVVVEGLSNLPGPDIITADLPPEVAAAARACASSTTPRAVSPPVHRCSPTSSSSCGRSMQVRTA